MNRLILTWALWYSNLLSHLLQNNILNFMEVRTLALCITRWREELKHTAMYLCLCELRSIYLHVWATVYMHLCTEEVQHEYLLLSAYVYTPTACASMSAISEGTDVGTDCSESPATCSISGFCCLGELPCIYTLAWLTEQASVLMREPPI